MLEIRGNTHPETKGRSLRTTVRALIAFGPLLCLALYCVTEASLTSENCVKSATPNNEAKLLNQVVQYYWIMMKDKVMLVSDAVGHDLG